MQNYQSFIDELFRLNIDTVQYFVKDEQVLYDIPVAPYAEATAEQLPGHVATFMNLDRYDQHQTQNHYADTLVELQRRAVTDLLLLNPEQTNRVLVDAKRKCEQLTNLLKKALEYQKAWHFGTLDQLSASFLQLQLLDAFVIPDRPEASPHERFAHNLTDAIMYKRGMLSAFIKQIETSLQTAPAVLPETEQEPEYDLWYINNDDEYAFAKIKELASYLTTIEPYTRRIEWFFETSRILEIEPLSMGVGKRTIAQNGVFSHRNEDGKPVDKNGNPVEVIAWGVNLDYSNDEEKTFLHKTYFHSFYRNSNNKFMFKPRLDFEQLQRKYSAQIQTERGKRLQLEWVTGEIIDRQQLINEWIAANPHRYGNSEIIRQLQNAASLIEHELEGIPAIKWELFYRTIHLDPFALLWGLVEFKRFLETGEFTASALSALPAPEEPRSSKPVNCTGFDVYILEKHRAKLMPYLTQNYMGLEPRFYAYLVGALIKLEIIPESTRHSNKSAVHRALMQSFKVNFPYQSWNTAINRLDPQNIDEDKRQIDNYYQRIKNYLQL